MTLAHLMDRVMTRVLVKGADVFAPRHDEIMRLDDPPLGDDMTSRETCVGDEELPMELSMTQSLPS
jgi:hypothetical protein